MTERTVSNKISNDSVLGLLIIVISWLVYLYHLCPTIYWRDSAEFVTTGFILGVPHPAGSPTYSLITKLFTFIPVGDIAFRVNLVSASFGAVAVYLLFKVVEIIIRNVWPGEDQRLVRYTSFTTALLFMFSATFWRFSEVAEVYTQQIFWLLLVILLLLQAGEEEEGRARRLMLASFFYGLSTGSHAVMGFYLPGILLYLFLLDGSIFKRARKFCPLIFFLFLGLSVYLYVPLRSSADPWLDWGNPERVKSLIYHLLDKKDVSTHFALRASSLIFQLKGYASMLPGQFSYFGLLLVVIGFRFAMKNGKTWCLLFSIFFIHFAFFIRTWRADFGYIPTFTIMALWAGIGFHRLILFLRDRFSPAFVKEALTEAGTGRISRPVVLLYLLMMVTILSLAVTNRTYADKSGYLSTYRFGKYILNSVSLKGVLLDQFAWFQTLYFQAAENSRPDVSSILRNAFVFPEVFYEVDNEKFPLLRLPGKEERSSPYKYMMNTIEKNLGRLPIYWYQVDKLAPLRRMAPKGIVYQLLPEGTEVAAGDLDKHAEMLYGFMEPEFDDPYFWADEEGRKVYSLNLTGLGMYFLQNRRYKHALLMQQLALQIDPESFSVINNYGVLYEYLGKLDKAEEKYRKAVELEPGDYAVKANLGISLYKQGKDKEAREMFNQSLKIYPFDQAANYHLGILALESREESRFVRLMAKVLSENRDSKYGKKARKRLREYRRGESHIPENKTLIDPALNYP